MAIDPEDRFYMNLGRWAAERAEDKRDDHKATIELSDIRAKEDAWRELYAACESPIEEILAAELLFLIDGYNEVEFDWSGGYFRTKKGRELWGDAFATYVASQESVEGRRTDFTFHLLCKGTLSTLVVECDGHDFHERTKEQAKRDRSYDRKLTAAGITLLRFTGSEIFRDPKKCAEEIQAVLEKKMGAIVEGR